MSDDHTPFLRLDAGASGTFQFNSPEKVQNWIQTEREFWSWTNNNREAMPYPIKENAVAARQNLLAKAQNSLTSLKTNDTSPEKINPIVGQIQSTLQLYARTGLVSTSPQAHFIEQIRVSDGPGIAFAALNHALGGLNPTSNDQEQRRFFRRASRLYDSFDGAKAKALPKALSTSLKKIADTHRDTIQEEVQNARAVLKNIQSTKDQIENQFEELKEAATKHWESVTRNFDENTNAALERIENTRKTYQEQMHLGASVDYWNVKADKHEAQAKKLKKTLIWFAIAASVILCTSLSFLGFIGLGVALHEKASATTPLLFIGLGLVLTTGFMWAVRILVRLFLSEHHLGVDARERATMALTFLALTNEGKIEPSERALVLEPLFRPTADGIIKDDGAPDASLASLISRIRS